VPTFFDAPDFGHATPFVMVAAPAGDATKRLVNIKPMIEAVSTLRIIRTSIDCGLMVAKVS
jgi:hypothetical protein